MILLVVEHVEGKASKSAYELVTVARELGREGPVTALVLGAGVASLASEVSFLVDQVLVVDRPELKEYDGELWAAVISQIAQEGEAHTVLIPGSRSGREYSPRVAVRLDAPLLEDVTNLKSSEGVLVASHYTCLARVTETVETDAVIAVVSVKPGVFPASGIGKTAAEQFDVDVNLPERRLIVTGKEREQSNRISLVEADVVVAGGRGVGSPQGFDELVVGLADRLGAAVAATRAIVDAGWRPYAEQVGQTGKTVQPKAYIAIGISGAVQHLSGMNKSKCIVAINKDADAPIFKIADYGIVGDVREIVPAIIEELQRQPAAAGSKVA